MVQRAVVAVWVSIVGLSAKGRRCQKLGLGFVGGTKLDWDARSL